MIRLRRGLALTLGAMVLASGWGVTTAQAAFPGENGDIAFSDMPSGSGARSDVFTVDSLGALPPVPFTNAGYARYPAWSPDGTKLAYAQSSDIFVANADGSGKTLVLDWDSTAWDLDWSPDGTMLVAELWACVEDSCTPDIYTMNIDGSGLTSLTGADTYPDRHPAWAPDGSKIAFGSVRDGTPGIFTMNPDGSDVTRITSYSGAPADRFDSNPDWSPDSQKIIFNRGADDSDWPWAFADTLIVNRDGAGLTGSGLGGFAPAWSPDGTHIAVGRALNTFPAGSPQGVILVWKIGTNPGTQRIVHRALNTHEARDPDWRPLHLEAPTTTSGYPRPKGTEAMTVSLVPAYRECTAPNSVHGPPLGFGSCDPPQREVVKPTVGTPDANGFPAQSKGELKLTVLKGDPTTEGDEADVSVVSSVNDVRRADGVDYTGILSLRLPLRITDKGSAGGADGSATVVDFPVALTMPCFANFNDSIGSTCSISTTVEAVYPGFVTEGKRANWELGRVQLYDGEPPSSDAARGWKPFETQGIFVP